jgi:type IV secretory pathway TrbF-like protein
MTDAELAEEMHTLANQFVDVVRGMVPDGLLADQWEDAFRWAMEKPDNAEVRAYAEKALAAATTAADREGMGI